MLADSGLQLPPAEAVIRAIYHSCMQGMLPDLIGGAEYWVQVNAPRLDAHLYPTAGLHNITMLKVSAF